MSVSPVQTVSELLPKGAWTVDAARSSVGFEARHLRVARIRGRFRAFECRIEAGPPVQIAGSVEVASIDTGDTARDTHLLDASFFDAAGHPRITFKAGDAAPEGGHGGPPVH